MTTATISNSAESDLKSTILWQYDNATNLVAIITLLATYFKTSTTDIWDKISSEMCLTSFDADNNEQTPTSISDFALAVVGKLIGVPRPTLNYGTDDSPDIRPMSSELYRKVLVARLRLSNSNASIKDYLTFIKYIFGENVDILYGEDMSIGWHWWEDAETSQSAILEQKLAFEQCMDTIVEYPTGIKSNVKSTSPMLGFEGQAKVADTDPAIDTLDNSSFNWL